VYAEAGVRDTHWLHICSHAYSDLDSGQVAESLAKLSLPDCADKLSLFAEFPGNIKSLYAAAIFKLIGRGSLDLCGAILSDAPEHADRVRLIQATSGDFRDLLAFKSFRTPTAFESQVKECVLGWTGVRVFTSGCRLAVDLESVAQWIANPVHSPDSAVRVASAGPEAFVLVECLCDERDWYHESAHLESKAMRERGHSVRAERAAELAALRLAGWKVLVVSEKDERDNLVDLILKQFLSLS